MNFLSNLPQIVKNKKKRIGRGLGSGRGAKSGRGTTRHQAARGKIPLHFEGGQGRMVKRYPLLRGKGKNNSIRQKPVVISISDLNKYEEGSIVDVDSLIAKNIIDESAKRLGVKLLAGGKLEKKLTVKIKASEAAKAVIRNSGGHV